MEGLPLGTVGGTLVRHNVPLDGEYVLQVKLFRTNLAAIRGLEHPHQVEMTVDGQRVFAGQRRRHRRLSGPVRQPQAVFRPGRRPAAGPPEHDRGAARDRRGVPAESAERRHLAAAAVHPELRRPVGLHRSAAHRVADDHRTSRRRLARETHPAAAAFSAAAPRTRISESRCAEQILDRAGRAARIARPLTDADVRRLLEFYQAGRQKGTFEAGIQLALRRMLASPKFVFRAEQEPANAAPGTVYRVSDMELASRLSFFLWSSIPDDELLDAAKHGTLSTPAVLEQQVRRMLADPRADALVTNFAGQWLQLRNLRNIAAGLRVVPGLRRQPAAGVPARDRAVPRQHRARRSERAGSVDRRLHLRERTPRAALRHAGHLRQPFPPRAGGRRSAARAARPGQHADRDVAHRSHVAGAARQVDPRQHPRACRRRRRRRWCRRSRRATTPASR